MYINETQAAELGGTNSTWGGYQKRFASFTPKIKQNYSIRFNNESINTTSTGARLIINNLTWTPYIYYTEKTAEVSVSETYTNTGFINNIEAEDDLPAPVFSSSDSNIATVDENTGEVTGVAPGTVTITATSGEITATYSLEVTPQIIVTPQTTLTETFTGITTQVTNDSVNTFFGDYNKFTGYAVRRGSGDFFTVDENDNTISEPADVWMLSVTTADPDLQGFVKSAGLIEGGVKTISFTYGKWGSASGSTIYLRLYINEKQEGELSGSNAAWVAGKKQFASYTPEIKQNYSIRFRNESVNPRNDGVRLIIKDLTWTPYIYYTEKTAEIAVSDTYTNTGYINNI
jgi:hypothetical protein